MVSTLKTMVHLINHERLVTRLAERLKKEYPGFKQPSWAIFVKTSTFNLEPPVNPDWWYIRAASIIRKLAVYDSIGVGQITRQYGGRRRRGQQRERSVSGVKGYTRRIMKGLEEVKLVQKDKTGRRLSPSGVSFIESTCRELLEPVIAVDPRVKVYLGEAA